MANSLVGSLGAKFPDSKVIFDDDFRDGFCGWQPLMDASTPRPALALTTDVAMTGPFALRIGTGNASNSAKDGFAVGIKRTSRVHDTGIVHYDLWWSWGAILAPSTPQDIEFGIDTQARDGSKRNYFKVRYELINTVESPGATTYQWRVWNGTQYVTITGAPAGHNLFNENKQNWQYLRVAVDLGASKYKEVQIGDQVFNLTSLGIDAGPVDSTVQNFDGGLNFAVHLYNRGGASVSQSWVNIDRARGWFA